MGDFARTASAEFSRTLGGLNDILGCVHGTFYMGTPVLVRTNHNLEGAEYTPTIF